MVTKQEQENFNDKEVDNKENLLLSPKYDVVFHSLFRKGNEKITRALIEDITGREYKIIDMDKNVIILLVGMHPGDRIYEVQGYGTAQEMLNDKRCSKILDYMYDDMAGGNYYSAIQTFCNQSYKYMGKPPMLDSIIFSPIFQLLICLIAGIIPVVITAYNSGGRTTTGSHTYLDRNNSRIIGSFDRYTHTTVKRTHKPQNNSSHGGGGGGGGSSSHSSGGGRSF